MWIWEAEKCLNYQRKTWIESIFGNLRFWNWIYLNIFREMTLSFESWFHRIFAKYSRWSTIILLHLSFQGLRNWRTNQNSQKVQISQVWGSQLVGCSQTQERFEWSEQRLNIVPKSFTQWYQSITDHTQIVASWHSGLKEDMSSLNRSSKIS